MSKVIIILKTQDTEVPPNAVLAQIDEHVPQEGPSIVIFLDNLPPYRAKVFSVINGRVLGTIPSRIIAEQCEF